jgi:hypothetical protein
MTRSGRTGQRLVAVFAAGVILLDFPILSLFARPVDVGGVPLLYAYAFGAWTLLIALMAFAVGRPPD